MTTGSESDAHAAPPVLIRMVIRMLITVGAVLVGLAILLGLVLVAGQILFGVAEVLWWLRD